MRKKIVGSEVAQPSSEVGQRWLHLEDIATVEVTSEYASYPIESALGSGEGPGWRASQPGEQQIRILFDAPVTLHRIQLRFEESQLERTQEFVLRWSAAPGGAAREIVRQQWNFSPSGSTTEVEDIVVDLDSVSFVELSIIPDRSGGEALASLASWRLG